MSAPPQHRLLVGDCLALLPGLAADSVDAVVTDPPYGLNFMGKAWDYDVPRAEVWREVLRVLKPGGHLLSFFGTRTYHRGVVQIEDAGFEIRDCLVWMYGQGFPKSLDVSKAIDAAAGATRDVVGPGQYATRGRTAGVQTNSLGAYSASETDMVTAPATEAAKQWQGFGTALKPAWEPVVLARKPLIGTVASNVLAHGTGGLNVDGCRVGTNGGGTTCNSRNAEGRCLGHGNAGRSTSGETFHGPEATADLGRWPPNVCLDEAAAAALDEMSGERGGGFGVRGLGPMDNRTSYALGGQGQVVGFGDSGGASRFFYTAKASRSERGEGNVHPTVKPVSLMRWLVRLVTPPGGLVLDPFAGSGTTGVAALQEGFRFIGIEREPDYAQIAERRLADAMGENEPQLPLFEGQRFAPKPPRPSQLALFEAAP